MSEIIKEYDAKMQKTVDVVVSDFASVRAGRANAGVLDRITVDAAFCKAERVTLAGSIIPASIISFHSIA